MIKVEGLAELEKALFELGSTVTARRVGQRALLVAAEPMVAAIKALAPDDPKTTPSLKDTIKAAASTRNRSKDTAEIIIGIDGAMIPSKYVPRLRASKKNGSMRLELGAYGYGLIDEFGSDRQAPSPYMRPGFDATAASVIARVGQTLGPEIEKSATRLARRRARAAGS